MNAKNGRANLTKEHIAKFNSFLDELFKSKVASEFIHPVDYLGKLK